MANFNANQESQFGLLPILKGERQYNIFDNSCVNVGLAIASWCFMIGASMATFAGFWTCLWGTLAGNMISVLVMTWMPCLSSSKYGIDGYSGCISFMGVKGKNFILGCVAIFIVGWVIVLSTMFGRSISNITAAFVHADSMSYTFTTIMSIICVFIMFLVVWKGPVVIKKFNNIVAPMMIVVIIMLSIVLTVNIGWENIVAAEPTAPYPSKWVNFLVIVELNFGAGLSWWPEMGGLSRLCKTSRAAYWANLVGLVLAATIATAVGTAACLTLGTDDPTTWMLKLSGVTLGVLALLFIAIANITSAATDTYALCLGLKGTKLLQKVSWGKIVGVFSLIVAICLALGADWIYDHFYIMLGVTCVFYVPMTAIAVVDYFLLRKQKLEMRSLFNMTETSKYYFWGGINWVALIIFIVAALFYLVFFNPATLVVHKPFVYFTASFGTFVPTAVIYWFCAKSFLVKKGVGGYPSL